LPIVIRFYVSFKIIKKTKYKGLKDIGVTSGRRELDLPAILAEEREIQAMWPWWKKWWNIVF
jgi:amino acid transporter